MSEDVMGPEELEMWALCLETQQEWADKMAVPGGCRPVFGRQAQTIAAYASIVQRLTELGPITMLNRYEDEGCFYCGEELSRGIIDHAPDCPYLELRRLRGME